MNEIQNEKKGIFKIIGSILMFFVKAISKAMKFAIKEQGFK